MNYEDDHFPQYNLDDSMEGNDLAGNAYPIPPMDEYGWEPSVCSENTVETYRKSQRKNMDEYKKIDKGYRKISFLKSGKTIDIEYYQTFSTPGTMIRDAITGARYNEFRVGSKEEDQFFKVRLAVGNADNDSMLLFYDSPEVYEGHMHATVSAQMKEEWRNKCAISRKAYAEKQAARSGPVIVR